MTNTDFKWFHFRQNNIGGSFDVDEDVNKEVLIQAISAAQANQFAENIGIYFDGVSENRDCECCGDRWRPVSDYDGEDVVDCSGDDAEDVKVYPFGSIN